MKKADHSVDRAEVGAFQQIVNVGPAIEREFKRLGLQRPQELKDYDPWSLYRALCEHRKTVMDPCVLDVFMASIDYMNGGPPRKWWDFTKERKRRYTKALDKLKIEIAG